MFVKCRQRNRDTKTKTGGHAGAEERADAGAADGKKEGKDMRDRERVVFFSKQDLARGFELQKGEDNKPITVLCHDKKRNAI